MGQSLNASQLRDRIQALAHQAGVDRWDLGAACSDDCSVQVDRGEAKQLGRATELNHGARLEQRRLGGDHQHN